MFKVKTEKILSKVDYIARNMKILVNIRYIVEWMDVFIFSLPQKMWKDVFLDLSHGRGKAKQYNPFGATHPWNPACKGMVSKSSYTQGQAP